ncbi:MAG TPA: phosphodiester glycosidase family protein [Abditibacterium sp.]|jgi:hypothetical protein
MRFSGRRRSFTLFFVAVALAALGGGALFSRLRAQETRETREIAPGLTLLSVSTQTPSGPLRFWLVKAEKARWKLGLEVADASDVIKKRSVRSLAAQSGAMVAINGGFFAYGGAAVGGVKVGGEWHRLPWKNRTALGWNEKDAQIGPQSGRCELQLSLQNGEIQTQDAALNGFSLPGSHAPLTDGFAVLTRRFAAKYTLKTGEIALYATPVIFTDGHTKTVWMTLPIDAREVTLPANDFVLIARGPAAALAPQIRSASWKVVPSPAWDEFPHILGAGPRLVSNSVAKTNEVEEEFRPDVTARGPRTAVGFDAQRNWLFLVADGRQAASVGLSLPETAALFQQLGAVEAMNLDGGSSTQLVISGELINTPSGYDPVNPLRPREVQVTNALTLKAAP